MKKILLTVIFALSLLLVGCLPANNGNGDGTDNPDEVAKTLFNERLQFLDENNFELEIKVKDHQALKETIVMMYFDGDVVKYIDGDYEAYYDNSGSKSKLYEKQGNTFVVSESNFKSSDLFFYGFEFEQFSVNNETSYIMKSDALASLDGFIGLHEAVDSIEVLQLRANENHIHEIIFDIVVNETTYLVTLTISNIGQVNLVLPA